MEGKRVRKDQRPKKVYGFSFPFNSVTCHVISLIVWKVKMKGKINYLDKILSFSFFLLSLIS